MAVSQRSAGVDHLTSSEPQSQRCCEVHEFRSKPFDRIELRTHVQTIMRVKRYRRLLTERVKFAWVVDHVDDGFLVISATDQIRYANAQARAYLCLPPDPATPITEPFQITARKHYHCEPQDAWANWPNRPPVGEAPLRYLVRPESATAHACWLAVNTLRLPSDRGAEWLIQLRDVTTDMAIQGDIWKFQSLVHHKLRTPLVHLLGLETLAQHAAGLSLEQITSLAEIAVKGARRLQEVIDDILDYLSAPSLVPPEAGFPLDQLPRLVQAIGATMGVETIAVACQAGLMSARLVLGRQTIELILNELLENAKKFHPQHSPAVEVLVNEGHGETACIQVRDDGVTLTPKQLSQAWLPYYQGEKYFTGQVAGMGLGLARVASIVWAVGGTCRLINRDDRPGVVVELSVPVTKIHNHERE